MDERPILATLGLFIIDENIYPPSSNRKPEYDIIGGGASYAIIGGRIAVGARLSRRILGIVDKGTDFPIAVTKELDTWNTGIIYRDNPNRLTTRGANVYGEDGVRNFVYRTPKRRILGSDIIATGNLLELHSFHFCCGIDRCAETIDLFLDRRDKALGRPKMVFEPFPEVCVPENLAELQSMLNKVDVFTPNLNEAAAFFSIDHLPTTETEIANLSDKFFRSCSLQSGVVIRCGALGCFIKTQTLSVMLPAYHTNQENVVDVTGGGNSFCGAFAAALVLSDNWLLAGIMANIASGIVVERLGMPKLEKEGWNGVSISDRLTNYLHLNQDVLRDHRISLSDFNWLEI